MGGYAPDPDCLAVFAQWEDAREYLLESLTVWANSLEYSYGMEDDDAIAQAIISMDAAGSALARMTGPEPVTVYPLDERGYTWPHWISESTERPENY